MSREAPKIGLDSVYIAKVLSDTADGIVYDTPISLVGGVNISINPNSSVDTDFADDGAFVTINNRGKVDATVELIDVENAIISQMLGQSYVTGVVTEKSLDQSPYFAMMFRVLVATEGSTPVYHLFCYAKGRFSVPETTASTKKDTIDFGHTILNATFINTNYDNKIICSHCRTDDPSVPIAIINGWFTTPVLTGHQNLNVIILTLDETSTSSEVIVKGSLQSGTSPSFNIIESTLKKNQSVIAFDENGDYINGINITLLQTSPAQNPKFSVKKWTASNPIKRVVLSSDITSSLGGKALPCELVIS